MKQNIAIIMGGYSAEVDISIKSGNVVYSQLDKEKYTPFRVLILLNKWVVLDAHEKEYQIDKNDFSFTIGTKKIVFDCVFNAIHGNPGENGFVKPNNSGSSIGISKAHKLAEILPAIQTAFKEDSEILIESFIEGREVSVGVIQYQQEVIVLPITEIVTENDFFDYEAKYQGKSTEITPAILSPEIQEKVVLTAKKVYYSLSMSGFSRAEFILVKGEPYFLEINTVPGLTEESILPQQAACAGISLTQLFDNAIQLAIN